MVDLQPYPRFSLAERDRRWAAVRKLMREQAIDVIVTPSNTGHSTDFQSNTRWLTHVGGGGDADIAAVFPLEGEVTAIATSAAPRWPNVQDWTPDVREARRAYGRATVERLKELKVDNARIGIAGLGAGTRTPEGTILYGFWLAMREAFPKAEFVDATDLLMQIRMIKSPEEIEALKKSTQIIEKGVEAKIEFAQPGAIDWEVWSAAMYAMMKHGSEMPVHQHWASGKNPIRTMTRPNFRALEAGDLIIDELEASWIGYRAQIVYPVFVQKVHPVHAELFKIQHAVFDAVMPHLKPGVTVRDLSAIVEATGGKETPKSGPTANALCRLTMHGRGAGDDGPIITDSSRNARDMETPLEENMVMIFKPSAETADGPDKSICTWGDTIVVTKQGGERLGTLPHELGISRPVN
jgi:Xaa-Pro aminopeptidase